MKCIACGISTTLFLAEFGFTWNAWYVLLKFAFLSAILKNSCDCSHIWQQKLWESLKKFMKSLWLQWMWFRSWKVICYFCKNMQWECQIMFSACALQISWLYMKLSHAMLLLVWSSVTHSNLGQNYFVESMIVHSSSMKEIIFDKQTAFSSNWGRKTKSMAQCKRDTTQVWQQWSYVSFALSHWYDLPL